MQVPRTPRERVLAFRIDQKAHEILAARQKWRPGMLGFSNPYNDLTSAEEDFIAGRIAAWEFEIIRRNGRET
jgi:hypothetical protein